MTTEAAQLLRKELLHKAQQLRALIQKHVDELSRPLDDTMPLALSPGAPAVPLGQPVQLLTHPTESPADFRLADFPEAVKKCKQIISVLRRHRDAGPFNQPVDPLALQIPDYLNVIKRPMDLGTVTRKLDNYQRHYTMAQELAEDVRLIWHNCKLYNGQQHALSHTATELERIFEAKFKGVLDRYAAAESDHASSTKRQKGDADRSSEDMPMTYEEKHVLGQLIGSLDNAFSTQVFQLIQKSCPQALDDTSDEVELDIEKLDVRTARELERFVKTVAAAPRGPVSSIDAFRAAVSL